MTPSFILPTPLLCFAWWIQCIFSQTQRRHCRLRLHVPLSVLLSMSHISVYIIHPHKWHLELSFADWGSVTKWVTCPVSQIEFREAKCNKQIHLTMLHKVKFKTKIFSAWKTGPRAKLTGRHLVHTPQIYLFRWESMRHPVCLQKISSA